MANKYRAWADGEVLTAANLIDYVQKQVVVVCDSSSDYPDSSTRREGMPIWDKNLDKLLVYTTSTTGWVPPWNLPWGHVASTSVTSTQSLSAGSTAFADLSSLSVTFTPVQNRRYMVRFMGPFYSSVANDTIVVAVRDAANNVLAQGGGMSFTDTAPIGIAVDYLYTTSSTASTTLKMAARLATGGTGTVTMAGAAGRAATIVVTDIGPSSAPA